MLSSAPEAIKNFVERVAKLPGIGPRQATRLAFALTQQGKDAIRSLAKAVSGLENLQICSRCYFVYDGDGKLCDICSDPERDQATIAIVEKETDLISLERTKYFHGRYLVLGELDKTGILSAEKKLRLKGLIKFIEKELRGKAKEIIVALSPTVVGDINSNLLARELKPFAEKLTRLGRGIPTGGEIEFADEETLKSALEQRK
jgi:recombination protein RecR